MNHGSRQKDRHKDTQAHPGPGRQPGEEMRVVEIEAVDVHQCGSERDRGERQERESRGSGLGPDLPARSPERDGSRRDVVGTEERGRDRRLDGPRKEAIGPIGEDEERDSAQ